MPYLLMVLSSVVGITGSSAIKQYEKKHDSGRFLYLTILCFFSALFFVVADRNGFAFTPKLVLYGLISGAFYCSAYFLTFVAYACGSFALTNLIISFSLVASVIYGIFFLHDELSTAGYIGIVLIFVSLFFINMRKKGEKDRSGSLKWFLAALGCFVGNGGIAVVRKIQQVEFDRAYDNEYSFIMAGSSFIVFLLISLTREKDEWKHFFSLSRLYPVLTGLCNGSQNFLTLLINSMLIISLAGPLTVGINTIVYFSVSLIFFKEKYSRNQLIGVVIGIISVILLSF